MAVLYTQPTTSPRSVIVDQCLHYLGACALYSSRGNKQLIAPDINLTLTRIVAPLLYSVYASWNSLQNWDWKHVSSPSLFHGLAKQKYMYVVQSRTIYVIYRMAGSVFAMVSLAPCDNWLGNWMSKSMIRSPFLPGCLGMGRPSPGIRRIVLGFTISVNRIGNFRPSKVGMESCVPTSACNKRKTWTSE